MSFLLDTNVVSEALRQRPEARVLDWIATQNVEELYLSVLTVGELVKGIVQLGDTARATQYREWLETVLKAQYRGRILEVDERVAEFWGTLVGQALRVGRPLPGLDSYLAATAATHNLTLVTRNTKDFEGLPLKTLNPWI